MTDFDELLDDITGRDQKQRRALMLLLDDQRDRQGHLLALSARMGATRSFVTSASLDWISQRIKYAAQLPMFREHRDPETQKITIDRETYALVQQREPDWRRQYPMTLYLAKRQRHKFPPILVVASQKWVDDPNADEWSSDQRALRDSVNAQGIDSAAQYVDLNITEQDLLYAIDGQHRLMAIHGLTELLTKGQLYPKTKDKKERATPLTIEQVVEQSRSEVTRTDLQSLLSERIGVEIIPAVQKGETFKEALRRLRSIFVHVNRTAVRLSEGELALLDEDDGFAVVARMVMVNHPLLRNTQLKRGQLREDSEDFTTLETLVGISRGFLGQQDAFQDWKADSRGELPVRPEEESLDSGYNVLFAYCDALTEIPSHRAVANGESPARYRTTESDDANAANILFRPLGQMALAEAAGVLTTRDEHPVSLSFIARMLSAKEAEGQLRCDRKDSPWFGVAWDPHKRKMQRSNRKLCAQMFIHLLGGGTPEEDARESLRQRFAEARTSDPDAEKGWDHNGRIVKLDSINLPSPW